MAVRNLIAASWLCSTEQVEFERKRSEGTRPARAAGTQLKLYDGASEVSQPAQEPTAAGQRPPTETSLGLWPTTEAPPCRQN